MRTKTIFISLLVAAVIGVGAYAVFVTKTAVPVRSLQSPVTNVTISGTYQCLELVDKTSAPPQDCTFGLKTDEGIVYAVNFGQTGAAMEQFKNREHITAEGFVVPVETLSTDQWQKFDMKGIFTITKLLLNATPAGKLDINAVCQGALTYMTFPDEKSADLFVLECIEGKHPEVIEQYKKTLGAPDGAAI